MSVRRRRRKRTGKPWRPLASCRRRLTSLREAREVTSAFHRLTSEIEAEKSRLEKLLGATRGAGRRGGDAGASAGANRSGPETSKCRNRIRELECEMEKFGGRARYQEASMLLTEQNKSSSQWVFKNVTRLGMRPGKGQSPLRTLEVGAINTQLSNCPFLDVTAIDLKSRNPKIKEQDFFELPIAPVAGYDVICNAMVINCVPTPEKRGEMILRSVWMLRTAGLLLLVLPLRFVSSLGGDAMNAVLDAVGIERTNSRASEKIHFLAGTKRGGFWTLQNFDSIADSLETLNDRLRAVDGQFCIRFNIAECRSLFDRLRVEE